MGTTLSNLFLAIQLLMTGVGGPSGAAPASMGRVDIYLDMNTGSINDVVTPSNLLAGSRGNTDAWTCTTSPMTGMTLQASNQNLPGPVKVFATTYGSGNSRKRIAYDHNQTTRVCKLAIPGGHPTVTACGWLTFGPPNNAPTGGLYDYVGIFTVLGKFAMFQLANGNGPGNSYAVNQEDTGTNHGPYTTITPGGIYWVCTQANALTGVSQYAIYDTSLNQVGSTQVNNSFGTGETEIQSIWFGNNQVATINGTSYFENWVIAYTLPTFPILPTNCVNCGTIQYVQSNVGGNVCASATSCAVSFPETTTAGNLVGAVCAGPNGRTYTITDAQSNTWATAADQPQTTDGSAINVRYAKNIAGGSTDSVTCAISGAAATIRIATVELSGLSTSSPIDGTPLGAQADSSTAMAGGAVTTTSATALIFGAGFAGGAVQTTGGTNYNLAGTVPLMSAGSAVARVATNLRLVGSTGTYTAAFTNSVAQNVAGVTVAFKP